jgi:hypothetical protein
MKPPFVLQELSEGKTETAREDFLRNTEYYDNLKPKNILVEPADFLLAVFRIRDPVPF